MLAVGWIAVLTILAGVTMLTLRNRSRQAFQTASWQESLLAAESGVDIAVNAMRRSLYDPSAAWSGWTNSEGSGGGPGTGSTFFTSSALVRSGEGGQQSWVKVQVDAPSYLRGSSGEQWFRVRSTGYAEIPGGSVVTGESVDIRLRKLDFRVDRRTGEALNTPRAQRTIEAIVKPVGAFRVALLGDSLINMNNHNIVVDSYDSRDPAKSTNGFYDPAKRQENGHIATNGPVINLGSAHIYGDASTNGGEVFNASNVTGEIRDDFYQQLFDVIRPTMTPDAGTPSSVTGTTTIVAKSGTPTQVILSTLSLSGQSTLRFQGAADGSDTFVQVLVNGNVSMSGQGRIILDPGVHARFFVVGDGDFTGNGVANPNTPLNMQIYGVIRVSGDPNGSIKVAGNGGFRGTVYAPNYDITMVGGGNTDSIYGGFVGKSVTMTGHQAVHYDEALSDGGLVTDYKIVSWFEDNR